MPKTITIARQSKEYLTRIADRLQITSQEKIDLLWDLVRAIALQIPQEILDDASRTTRPRLDGGIQALDQAVEEHAREYLIRGLDPNFFSADLGLTREQKVSIANKIAYDNQLLFRLYTPILQEFFRILAK